MIVSEAVILGTNNIICHRLKKGLHTTVRKCYGRRKGKEDVLAGFLLLQRDNTATLKKKIFNWGGTLTISEVQTIIIRRAKIGMHADMMME